MFQLSSFCLDRNDLNRFNFSVKEVREQKTIAYIEAQQKSDFREL